MARQAQERPKDMKTLQQLLRDPQGSATIEQALILALVAIGFLLLASVFTQQVLVPLVDGFQSVLVAR